MFKVVNAADRADHLCECASFMNATLIALALWRVSRDNNMDRANMKNFVVISPNGALVYTTETM